MKQTTLQPSEAKSAYAINNAGALETLQIWADMVKLKETHDKEEKLKMLQAKLATTKDEEVWEVAQDSLKTVMNKANAMNPSEIATKPQAMAKLRELLEAAEDSPDPPPGLRRVFPRNPLSIRGTRHR